MIVTSSDPDWSLLQAFLAVAETGSLSAAARRMGSSQPTVGRQVQALEAALGATLFRRQHKGMALTETGLALLPRAEAMREAANEIGLAVAGEDTALEGAVRITASVFVSHYILPPVFARLRRDAPGIELELVATDESENLLFREADIAIRMYRPEQLDVVTRHVAEVHFSLFAATAYLDRKGRPETTADLLDHDFVGYDRNEMMLRGFREAGFNVDRHFFATRTDQQALYWELVKAGCGLGFCQRQIGRATPGVEEVPFAGPLPTLPCWLTAHQAMRRTPRVRRVWDALSEALPPLLS